MFFCVFLCFFLLIYVSVAHIFLQKKLINYNDFSIIFFLKPTSRWQIFLYKCLSRTCSRYQKKMAFQQYLLSLNFNGANAGLADRLHARAQQDRTGIMADAERAAAAAAAAATADWIGMNGVIIPYISAPPAPTGPRRPRTPPPKRISSLPAPAPSTEWEFCPLAGCMVWVGRR